jgi:hypothetical protein
MAVLEPYKGGYYLWKYIPSLAAAVIFLLLFIVATGYHSWKLHKTKARFCIAFVIGGICVYSIRHCNLLLPMANFLLSS